VIVETFVFTAKSERISAGLPAPSSMRDRSRSTSTPALALSLSRGYDLLVSTELVA
jgi:hypothetical protein